MAPLSWAAPSSLVGSGVIYYGISADASDAHVVWSAGSTPDTVHYRRSTDEGATYAADATLSSSGTTELDTPIVVSGATVIAMSIDATQSFNDGFARTGGDVRVRTSTDHGATFGTNQVITSGGKVFRFTIAGSGTTWNIFYMDYQVGYWNIYQSRSTDTGQTWSTPAILVSGNNGLPGNPGGPARPQACIDGNDLYLVWMDPRDNRGSCTFGGGTIPDCTEVYFKHSGDKGVTWDTDQRLTNNGATTYCGRPAVTAQNGAVVISYDYNIASGDLQIGMLRSPAKGVPGTWSTQRLLGIAGPGDNTHSTVAFGSSGAVCMAWRSSRSGVQHVYARMSDTSGLTWGNEIQVSSAEADIPGLAKSSNYWHLIFADKGGGALRMSRAAG